MKLQTNVTVFLMVIFTTSGVYTALDVTDNQNSRKINTTVEVVEATDGDTVDIKLNGERKTVRILGIDTPEISGENKPVEFYLEDTSKNRNCLESKGEEASNYVKNEVGNETVRLVQDPQADRVGNYGRLLGYIRYNNTVLGEELLSEGLARMYNSSFNRRNEYRQLEDESRRKEVGIWNRSCGR